MYSEQLDHENNMCKILCCQGINKNAHSHVRLVNKKCGTHFSSLETAMKDYRGSEIRMQLNPGDLNLKDHDLT